MFFLVFFGFFGGFFELLELRSFNIRFIGFFQAFSFNFLCSKFIQLWWVFDSFIQQFFFPSSEFSALAPTLSPLFNMPVEMRGLLHPDLQCFLKCYRLAVFCVSLSSRFNLSCSCYDYVLRQIFSAYPFVSSLKGLSIW